MSKLYATVSSEKASKGQGGNDFLEAAFYTGNSENDKENKLRVRFEIDSTGRGWFCRVDGLPDASGKPTEYEIGGLLPKVLMCEWCNRHPAKIKNWREISKHVVSVRECGNCARLDTESLRLAAAKGKKQKGEVCNFNACKNVAVYYGVCEKHKRVED